MSVVVDKSAPGAGFLKTLAAAVGALLVLTLALALGPRMPLPAVTRLDVVGDLNHVRPDEVRAALLPQLQAALPALDLDAIHAEAARLPWVAQVRVERVWPGTVRVSLREHEAAARWGEAALLSMDGVVFAPGSEPLDRSLPRLSGPAGQEALVLQTYRDLAERLQHSVLTLAELAMSGRGDWIAYTTQGLELRFGRGDPLAKLPLLLGAAVPALAERLAELAYVDLRYTNGFATGPLSAVAAQ